MKKKLLFVVLITSMFVLAACGGTSTPTSSGVQPQSSSSSSSSAAGMAISKSILLDPALASDADSKSVVGYVYETLIKMQDNAPVPGLAASVNASEDGLAYTLTLRPGVRSHDGYPINADAVIANFNRWFDPADSAHGSGKYDAWVAAFKGFKGSSTFDGAEKVDDLTVILHLNTPDPAFLTKLTDPAFSIVNPAAFNAAFGTASGTDGGTGPYIISAWTDTSLTLSPFAGYWNSSAAATGNMEFSLSK